MATTATAVVVVAATATLYAVEYCSIVVVQQWLPHASGCHWASTLATSQLRGHGLYLARPPAFLHTHTPAETRAHTARRANSGNAPLL